MLAVRIARIKLSFNRQAILLTMHHIYIDGIEPPQVMILFSLVYYRNSRENLGLLYQGLPPLEQAYKQLFYILSFVCNLFHLPRIKELLFCLTKV